MTHYRTLQHSYHTKREHYGAATDLLIEDEEEQLSAVDQPQEFDETQLWKDRSKDVDQLLTNFASLSEIFKELNYLVVEQGNILDRIDYNIEQTKSETEKAVKELTKVGFRQANELQKSKRATYCLVLLIGGISILTFALFLKHI